ncbi:MAG: hypothetical protein JO114_24295 [Planctomycetaceae bacterium]|nr:hypothetical protein [Planctomycetaceae bacterium]
MSERLLESRISALRGQVRRLLVFHGLSWLIAGVVPLVLLAGLADWLFHLDVFVRLALLLALGAVALWVVFKLVLRPLIVRFADLDIALRIEQRWPGLHDRLASTIQFLRLNPSDDRYGSPALREATIKQAIEETRSIDFREAIDYRPIVRAGSLAAAAVSLAMLFGLLNPASTRLAMRRLFVPWGGDRWPQQTHLALSDTGTTLKIARGDSFTLSVQVRPGDRIPETARVTYSFIDGEEITEPLRAAEGGEFHGRIETVNQPFKFSVAGGDDVGSIRDVEVKVVPPPALNRLTIRLVSPNYTGIPIQTLAAGLTSFRVLEGTRIELDAQANKALAAAELYLGDQPAAGSVAFNPARSGFQTSFPVKENVAFWFALKDAEGFRNRDSVRYDVRMFKDEAPRVVIAEPRTDRDVPADAMVPVRVELDDDFGLHSARLLYKVSAGDSEPHDAVAIPLWSAPGEEPGQAQPAFVKHQEIAYEWNLAPLKLAIGSIITFHADARDFDSIKGPNVGKSRELRLRIVSKEDAARQVDDGRRELREEIARILAMQRQAITPVEEATRTLSRTDRLPRAQRDDLNNAGLIQRQVGSRMSNRDEGLEQKLRRLLDDLRNFKIANPEARQQMQNMLERLNMLRDRHLGPAEQGLTRAGKSLEQIAEPPPGSATPRDETANSQPAGKQGEGKAGQKQEPPGDRKDQAGAAGRPQDAKPGEQPAQAGPKPQPQQSGSPQDIARRSLAEAKTNQKAIADELQKMLEGLGEFETYRGVVKDAQALLKKQEETMKQAAEAATQPDLMGKSAESLSPEQKAELGNLAARQSDLAKGLQNLVERMDDLGKRLDESDPLAASAMREAAGNSRKQGTSAKMGEAAEQLEKNQMGQARAQQDKARQELRELVDAVQNRRERELSRLVKELKKAESEMRDLRKREAQNLKATRDAKQNPNAQERRNQLKKLAKDQAQIQQELKRQLQRLAKLSADRAGRAASDASGKMGKAQEELDQDQGDQAGKNEEEALADLNDAQEELENDRKEAEERLAMEQLARMGDQLKSLAERQARLVGDTESYENMRRQSNGKLTIAQRAGIRGLGQVQGGLKDETGGLIEQLEGAPVFSLTLKRATESMEKAAGRLQAMKTDDETQKAVRSASHRFEQLIDSLKADDAKQGGQDGGDGGGGGGGGAGGGDGIPATAQLKMLKTLQQEINERTESFDELRRRNQKLTPEQTGDAERLANDQGALADLVRDLTKPKRDDGEE